MKKLIVKMLGFYLEILSSISPALAGRKGFLLFCRPSKSPINQKQLSFFYSADKFLIDHESYSVQAYRWGCGPKKILFLHGWESHTYRWKAYIDALPKDEFTLYSLDAPGHGLSSGSFLTVPLYSSLIEKFIKQHGEIYTVVGHSIGGFALLHTYYRLPQLPVDRIVLLAPPGEASDFVRVFQKTLGLSQRTVKLVVDDFARRYQVTPDFFSSRRFATGLKVKGLVVHDEDDQEAPYQYSVALQQAWENARLVTTKGLGHNLKSSVVVKEVVDFIQETVHQPA
jgi:pimeloyl-ACP methyl ester carboxylesterase